MQSALAILVVVCSTWALNAQIAAPTSKDHVLRIKAALESKDPAQVQLGLFAATFLEPTRDLEVARLEPTLAALTRDEALTGYAMEALAAWPLRRAAAEALLEIVKEDLKEEKPTEMKQRLAAYRVTVLATFPDDRLIEPLQDALKRMFEFGTPGEQFQVAGAMLRAPSLKLYRATRRTLNASKEGAELLAVLTGGGANIDRENYAASFGELPSYEQLRWAMTLSSPYVRMAGRHHHRLVGFKRSTFARNDVRQGLFRDWGIQDAKGLRDVLDWLRATGGRGEIAAMLKKVGAMTDAERAALQDPREIMAAKHLALGQLGEAGVYAWDACRLASMAAYGYIAEYIDQDTAVRVMMYAAAELQQRYSSWESALLAFEAGREMTHGRTDEGFRAAIQWLIKDPASPCAEFPWRLDLGPRPAR